MIFVQTYKAENYAILSIELVPRPPS